MTSYELMNQFPEFFAAALCVSGHWTREKIAECARRGQKIWTVLSELDGKGYPCISEVCEILSREGVDYGWYEWDARRPFDELSDEVRKAAAEDHTFRASIYTGDSALHLGMPDEVRSGHPAGWSISYRVEALLDWLIVQ